MSPSLLLLLLITPPDTPDILISSPSCDEIRVVLDEAVEEGLLSINEAIAIHARCARAPEF